MEKKSKIVTPNTFVFDSVVHAERKNTMVSVTVPGEGFTIKEILDRFTRGGAQAIGQIGKVSSFDSGASFDSPDLEKLRDSDLVDKQDFSDRLKSDISDFEKAELERKRVADQKTLSGVKDVESSSTNEGKVKTSTTKDLPQGGPDTGARKGRKNELASDDD